MGWGRAVADGAAPRPVFLGWGRVPALFFRG